MCLYALKMTVDEHSELYRFQKFIDWQQTTTICNLITKQTAKKWHLPNFCLSKKILNLNKLKIE